MKIRQKTGQKGAEKMNQKICQIVGIDPGQKGALVWVGEFGFCPFTMPLTLSGDICFKSVVKLLREDIPDKVFLERAVAFGMGLKGAFNYGRGFAAIEIALQLLKIPVEYVEPRKWTKVMHAGIDDNLKPKVKSEIAVTRLYPNLISEIERTPKGKLHDGVVDALLIAGYGARQEGLSFDC